MENAKFKFTFTFILYIMYALAQKAPLSKPQNQHFNYQMHPTTLHETYRMYIHFWKLVVSNPVGSTEATSGCGRARHVLFSRPIRTFVFDILRTTSRCIQFCSGCIAATCTPPPPATGPGLEPELCRTCYRVADTTFCLFMRRCCLYICCSLLRHGLQQARSDTRRWTGACNAVLTIPVGTLQ
jgi:hypothetical protein